MKVFLNYHRYVLFFVLICSNIAVRGADLVVASGQVYHVPAGQTETYDNVQVYGELIVEADARLNISQDLILQQSTGAKMTLTVRSLVDVAGFASIQQGCSLMVNNESRITMSALEARVGVIIIDQKSSLKVEDMPAAFINGSSLEVNRESVFTAAGSNRSNHGMTFGGSSLILDNSSRLEVTNGYLLFVSTSTADIRNSSKLIAEEELYFIGSTIDVASNGAVELYGNNTTETSTVSFTTGAEMRLLGGNQSVNYIPEFYNLVLGGTGSKSLSGTGTFTIKNKLDLGSRLLVVNNTVDVISTSPAAISRTSGFIVSGRLKRAVDAQSVNQSYLFPVGIQGKYRPVIIKPVAANTGKYVVEFRNGSANRLSSKIDQALDMNSSFYHKIYKEGDAPNADLSIFYSQSSSTNFNRIARWNSAITKWDFLSGLGGAVPATPYIGVTSRNVTLTANNNFNPGSTLYVLARAEEIPYISNTYGVLKRELDGGFYVAIQDTLRFRFEEEYATENTALKYTIYNKYHLPVNSLNATLPENTGDNRFKIHVAAVTPGDFAILEVQNMKGEKWYLRFKTKEF